MKASGENKTLFAEDLLRQVWTTKGARFNAHRRLRSQGKQSILAISLLSSYVLIITLLTVFPAITLSDFQSQLSFGTLAMAILILVLSVLEGAKEYALRGERMHQCAIELSGLYADIKLECEKHADKVSVSSFIPAAAKRYQEILARTAENHEILDYKYFQSQYPSEFDLTKLQVFVTKTLWLIRVYGFHMLLIWAPPVIGVLLFLDQVAQQ